ncbi:MAG: D-alanyl-D-alanine carboxypeptidase/D-alanyl-D-alanine-endopeptidase [Burkholderiaceae bacterium]|jgi:D-alanyl-D-alanine carboxypeptidase/D-alanyl-D-alanine-endopeptidase (penicillin-binding protein 4)|nr:D-alanyl-D-alanine carboxypeptidase/D-alanyl-D-alanine-endopeptidase [Burkholderiaceae bacterium]
MRWLRGALLCACGIGAAGSGWAQPTVLPPEIEAAISRAKLPRDSLSIVVLDAQGPPGRTAARLSHRANHSNNPASVMKLVTTYAALDLLGPAYTWATPVYLDGTVQGGTLKGNLYIKGQGDPKLVLERIWLLLRRVQALGIRQIDGNIVLDRSGFEVPDTDAASFDGEPLRPYNAAPDALLLNFKSIVLSFTPDRSRNQVNISVEPPLAGVQIPASVPLGSGDCTDYRGALKADFSDPLRIRFGGSYAAACGEKIWPVAYVDPKNYAARAIEGLWKDQGGQLSGSVGYGRVPAHLRPVFEHLSPALADVVRDINKFSNNVMAQQLLLTLGWRMSSPPTTVASFEASRDVVRRWWKDRLPDVEAPVLENGSGLSRQERIQPLALAQMLQSAYQSPVMSELLSSLPIVGVDGTLRRSKARTAQGAAHLKTGSLRDVAAIAGYVLGNSGKRYVLVAIANHSSPGVVNAARPVFDALIEWTQAD